MSVKIQSHPVGVTWHETDVMARAAHAVRTRDGVWLIDPFEDEEALAVAAELGAPVGVIQLLDRHNRDCAALAERLRVPHFRLPRELPDSPFQVISVIDRPWWRELALWWPEGHTLVVSEALGTGSYFALGRDAGVHPMLRLLPPRGALGGFHPQRLLVGHGPPVTGGADRALHQALACSRTDLPRLALQLPGALRGS